MRAPLRMTVCLLPAPDHHFMAVVLGQMKGGAVAGAAP
jgi:hypothetical protein